MKYTISERDREAWRQQNIADLLYWAEMPLTQRLVCVEGVYEMWRSIHGDKPFNSPDEHDEHGRLKK